MTRQTAFVMIGTLKVNRIFPFSLRMTTSQGQYMGNTVKPVLSCHSKRQKIVFKTDYHFLQVKSIAECSKGSILQYFRPSLSYHLSLRSSCLSNFEWSLKTGFTVWIFGHCECNSVIKLTLSPVIKLTFSPFIKLTFFPPS